jgi:hypothetical protein
VIIFIRIKKNKVKLIRERGEEENLIDFDLINENHRNQIYKEGRDIY